MDAVQIHTQATNGRITIDLPAEHAALANAKLLVLLVPEPTAPASSPEPPARPYPPTDWDALGKAWDAVIAANPYRDIDDPVQWQRELRDEWDRPLPGRP